eukprot:9050152-Ditylum_brightwellii.AAC.1
MRENAMTAATSNSSSYTTGMNCETTKPVSIFRRISKIVTAYGISIILVLYFFLVLLPFAGFSPSVQFLSEQDNHERPIIYTFQSKDIDFNNLRGDNMQDLFNTWRTSWLDAGWNPIILNEDDAKTNPDYEKFINHTQNLQQEHVDSFCMNRWLAMAAVGGGWFAEYDTFPIRMVVTGENGFVPTLPRRFTSFDSSVAQGKLPSLMS